jgi:hypothetical protein
MTKKIISEKISENLEHLIYDIPLEQRKRIVRSEPYRHGWLDSTMFWKLQFDKTFGRCEIKQGEKLLT